MNIAPTITNVALIGVSKVKRGHWTLCSIDSLLVTSLCNRHNVSSGQVSAVFCTALLIIDPLSDRYTSQGTWSPPLEPLEMTAAVPKMAVPMSLLPPVGTRTGSVGQRLIDRGKWAFSLPPVVGR